MCHLKHERNILIDRSWGRERGWGMQRTRTPGQNFSISMQLLKKISQIAGWRLPVRGWRHRVGNPPLILSIVFKFAVDSPALTTDDLLPILVYLVVKADVPNWWANLTFMKYCRFSKSSNDDEFGWVWANLTFMKYCRFSKSSNDDEFGWVWANLTFIKFQIL